MTTVRTQVDLAYNVNGRRVTVRAMDAVGPEDVYENMMKAVMARYVTKEDRLAHAGRDVKDFIIRSNLSV